MIFKFKYFKLFKEPFKASLNKNISKSSYYNLFSILKEKPYKFGKLLKVFFITN